MCPKCAFCDVRYTLSSSQLILFLSKMLCPQQWKKSPHEIVCLKKRQKSYPRSVHSCSVLCLYLLLRHMQLVISYVWYKVLSISQSNRWKHASCFNGLYMYMNYGFNVRNFNISSLSFLMFRSYVLRCDVLRKGVSWPEYWISDSLDFLVFYPTPTVTYLADP